MFVFMAIAALAGVVDSTLIKPPESVQIAIPKVSQRPVLDGKLDEPIWAEAAKLTDFVEFEPNDMVRGREKSIAYVAYDSQYLFLGFRAFESHPGEIRATVFPRERGGDGDDKVTFLLDTFLGKRRTFEFDSNPHGIQADGIKVEGQAVDVSPDFVWYSAGSMDNQDTDQDQQDINETALDHTRRGHTRTFKSFRFGCHIILPYRTRSAWRAGNSSP